jgi:hypothetical protein
MNWAGVEEKPSFGVNERASDLGSIVVFIVRELGGSILVQIEYHISMKQSSLNCVM